MSYCNHVLSTIIDLCFAIKSSKTIDVKVKLSFRINKQVLYTSSYLANLIDDFRMDPNCMILLVFVTHLNIAANLNIDWAVKH